MQHKYWCEIDNVCENFLLRKCDEVINSGLDVTNIFMSPDIYKAFLYKMDVNYPGRMYASSYTSLKNSIIYSMNGPVKVTFIPKYKNLLLIGTEQDYEFFTTQGVPYEFLSERDHEYITREFERTILGRRDDNGDG